MSLRSRLRAMVDRGAGGVSEVDQQIRALEGRLEQLPPGSSDRTAVLNDLGNRLRDRYLRTGKRADLEAAIESYRSALALDAGSDHTTFIRGNLAVSLSDRYSASSDWGTSKPRSRRAARRSPGRRPVRASTPAIWPTSRTSCTSGYYRTRDPADLDEAVETAERAIEHAPAGSREHAGAMLNLAVALLERGEVSRAFELLETAAASLAPGTPEHMRVVATLNTARLADDSVGDDAGAVEELRRVVERSPAGSLVHHASLHAIGALLWRQYQSDAEPAGLEASIDAYEAAVASAGDEAGELPLYLNDLGIALSERSFISDSAQGLADALAAWVRALNILDARFAAVPVAYKLGQQSHSVGLGIAQRVVAAYMTLSEVAVTGRDRFYRNAMWGAEGTKSRLLSELMGRGELPAPPGVAADQMSRERTLLEVLRALDTAELVALGQRAEAVAVAPAERLATRAAKHRELEALWAAMATAGPEAGDYVALRRGGMLRWEALTGLADLLGPRTALVSMFSTNSRTLMFVLRAGQDAPAVAQVETDPATQLDIVQRFDREVRVGRGRRGETWDRPLRPLLEAAAPHLHDAERVVLAPYGWGLQLPWSIVAARAGWRTPGGHALPLVTAESLGMLSRVLSRPRPAPGPSVVVGNPTGDLRHAEAEALEVAALLGVPAVLGAAATKHEVLQQMRGAAIAHLAAHAQFVTGSPLDSGVVLADGVLTAREILEESVQLDLLVLSACETGVAESLGGQELAGLSQAFLHAGARCLVASLWKVDDPATSTLMSSFYGNWRSGADLAGALSEATAAGRGESGGAHADPWDAFVLSGDWSATWPASQPAGKE